MKSRLVESAPELSLSAIALDQAVSWSASEKRPISLGEFIAARVPHVANKLGLKLEGRPKEQVKRVDELNDRELRETVCARLGAGPKENQLVIVGAGKHSIDELIHHVRTGSELGLRLVAASRRSIELIEDLAETGKIRSENRERLADLPEFDF